MTKKELITEIKRLKTEKNAVILAHYYSDSDVQDIADFLGDSLELSKKAASTKADIIVFCGVQFMAETAAVLSPNKKVLIPALNAGCSLAEGANAQQLIDWRKANPGGKIISYVNTTAEVKGETDICCTSANAEAVVKSFGPDANTVFVPDINLGSYIKKNLGNKMQLWDGNCDVHQKITTEVILNKLKEYPDAEVLIHPEAACSHDSKILDNPQCFFYSTSGIVRHVAASDKKTFIIGTEEGTLHKLQKDNPNKQFVMACEGLICKGMKLSTLKALYMALKEERYEVKISKELTARAVQPVQKMMRM
ncbi:MAG: quinolinate synthase NadA [Bacteroidales bacterium]